MKRVFTCHMDIYIDQWGKTQNPETRPYISSQLFFNKCAYVVIFKNNNLSTDDAGKNRHSYKKTKFDNYPTL